MEMENDARRTFLKMASVGVVGSATGAMARPKTTKAVFANGIEMRDVEVRTMQAERASGICARGRDGSRFHSRQDPDHGRCSIDCIKKCQRLRHHPEQASSRPASGTYGRTDLLILEPRRQRFRTAPAAKESTTAKRIKRRTAINLV
jgi:hypothetical protein